MKERERDKQMLETEEREKGRRWESVGERHVGIEDEEEKQVQNREKCKGWDNIRVRELKTKYQGG